MFSGLHWRVLGAGHSWSNAISCAAGDALSKHRRAGRGQGEVLVIGLGGGALPIYLHEVFAFNVDCVDLDETVVRLAKTHFGFEESTETPRLQVCSQHFGLKGFLKGPGVA